jgi:hypothetical protein
LSLALVDAGRLMMRGWLVPALLREIIAAMILVAVIGVVLSLEFRF